MHNYKVQSKLYEIELKKNKKNVVSTSSCFHSGRSSSRARGSKTLPEMMCAPLKVVRKND